MIGLRRAVPKSLRDRSEAGFTLIELIVVMAIVALLLTLAAPRYFHSVERSKEAVLKANLATTRDAIDKFRGDTGKYPDRLDVLVEKRYLKALPLDPITESRDTWIIVPPDATEKGGVFDLHSGADGNGLDGTPYKDW
ncbi:MAG TPA: prepilin-type N-terminal cleavage/methylation domain-containing protein [Rhodocyclaceae bacterium]|jgi:general secretion pathway protein G|nr:prepilin-type N-terminal cleavage/methylation domain-containing protein [Rhodocyclaceae bacterium]HMV55064.1 prepilin-type N-terminal cleavage/methylation domain-containing protein [Rhodocyclaceae bacterium]HMZ84915.1 prepilin-type N-terminal cleavage/methylation domain-containing protein [Rhodocyclaceae bacterium]HNA05030.1 prepilin-type N-terminal cleavage/methylation domain-containing protein [Rhodocyclaceae bacterium]HNB80195.1 prepilin-type N-terminal cleavage/methylation domain-contain